jgi:uncharacterized protein YaaN involved in tellurite resistance
MVEQKYEKMLDKKDEIIANLESKVDKLTKDSKILEKKYKSSFAY